MDINLYSILKKVLNESVDQNLITNAIDNKNVVRLKYVDNQAHATGLRTVEPYMLFIHKSSGNTLLLAYQWEGDTYRGKPAWKTLDINKIESGSWNTLTNKHFVSEPKDRLSSAPEYKNAHKYASSIIDMVTFDNNSNLYQPSLDLARNNTKALKNDELPSMDLSKLNVMPKGPIKQKKNNIYTSRPTSKKYSDYRKNLSDTERNAAEKARYWDEYDKAEKERENQQKLLSRDNDLNDYQRLDKDHVEDEENNY